ncbi:MAG: translation initiation factor eIF-1A [Candidatus Marsarchaeota archaeon]|nr:translation initiation factor eIF-1A [Candidatus Marsarchaeota archaeon]
MPRPNKNVDMRRGQPIEYKLKLPNNGEVLGKVMKLAGATRFVVKCSDGKERLCIIPGRLRRAFWIKENDVVIVRPWVVQTDERGDIVWRYSMLDISKLKERGMMANVE